MDSWRSRATDSSDHARRSILSARSWPRSPRFIARGGVVHRDLGHDRRPRPPPGTITVADSATPTRVSHRSTAVLALVRVLVGTAVTVAALRSAPTTTYTAHVSVAPRRSSNSLEPRLAPVRSCANFRGVDVRIRSGYAARATLPFAMRLRPRTTDSRPRRTHIESETSRQRAPTVRLPHTPRVLRSHRSSSTPLGPLKKDERALALCRPRSASLLFLLAFVRHVHLSFTETHDQ
jgi:hypothetical protein